MNPWANKTAEERAEMIQKRLDTRKKNKLRKDMEAKERYDLRDKLGMELKSIKDRIDAYKKHECFCFTSFSLTKKYLLLKEEIVKQSEPYKNYCGIYFLIENDSIVYVGQSVNIHSRIAQHAQFKGFSRIAYIICEPHELNVLESLYIHAYQPELNGETSWGGKSSPYSLQQLFDLAKGMNV
jgi:hypothetical protein